MVGKKKLYWWSICFIIGWEIECSIIMCIWIEGWWGNGIGVRMNEWMDDYNRDFIYEFGELGFFIYLFMYVGYRLD